MAWAGAYVGDGVSTTNLAGRTLRDLILGQESELTGLPWVNHRSKLWEPEPLRWLGVNAALKAMGERRRRGGEDRPAEQAGDLRQEAHRRLSLRPAPVRLTRGSPPGRSHPRAPASTPGPGRAGPASYWSSATGSASAKAWASAAWAP